ncbi:MAG: hypothetical protein ACF8SC_06195 [Phycisphaerales bacterium JB037]
MNSDQGRTRREPQTAREGNRSTPAATIEEIFLTPRVIDRGSFEEYSQTLRAIIDDATARTEGLDATTRGVDRMAARAREASDELKARLESAARALGVIESQRHSAEELCEKLGSVEAIGARLEEAVGPRVEQLHDRVEAMLARAGESLDRLERKWAERLEAREREQEQRLAELESKLDERVESAAARSVEQTGTRVTEAMGAAERRAKALIEGLEQRTVQIRTELAQSAGPIITNLNLLCQRAVEILGRDPRMPPESGGEARAGSLEAALGKARAVVREIDEKQRALEAMREQVESARRAASEAVLETAERADALEARARELDERAGEVEHRVAGIGPRVDRARESAEALERAIEAASARIDAERQRVDSVGDGLIVVDELCAQATERVENHLGELRAMLSSPVAELSEQARQVNAWLEGLVAQAKKHVEASRAKIRAMEDVAGSKAQSVREDLEKLAGESAERTRAAIEQLEAFAGERRREIEELRERARADADAACARIEEIGAERERSLGEAIESAAETLEPWRGVLEGDGGELPAAIRAVMERVERELGAAVAAIEKRLKGIEERLAAARAARTNDASRSELKPMPSIVPGEVAATGTTRKAPAKPAAKKKTTRRSTGASTGERKPGGKKPGGTGSTKTTRKKSG